MLVPRPNDAASWSTQAEMLYFKTNLSSRRICCDQCNSSKIEGTSFEIVLGLLLLPAFRSVFRKTGSKINQFT